MYNFTMHHHFRHPQAMFLIMDHCSIVTVGRLDHTYWRGPAPALKQQQKKKKKQDKTWPPKFLHACNRNITLLDKE
jgi:hypothetical protein